MVRLCPLIGSQKFVVRSGSHPPLSQCGPVGADTPLKTQWLEEAEADEVPCSRREGPEEILTQVGFLQGEVLVRLEARAHFGWRVHMLLPQCLLPKVLVLQPPGTAVLEWAPDLPC